MSLFEKVLDNNRNMDKSFRKTPELWYSTIMGLALRAEAYDVVIGIGNIALTQQRIVSSSQYPIILSYLINAFVAIGNLDKALALCVDTEPFYKKNSVLAKQAISLRDDLPEDKILSLAKAHNKPDIWTLALAAMNKERSVSEARKLIEKIYSPEIYLSLSNSSSCCNERTRALNAYLRKEKCDEISDINWKNENVINSIAFNNNSQNKYSETPVSVIMSAYNAADTVIHAISSILKQTHKNIELLVCDDCSSDNTISVIRDRFKNNEKIRLFKSIANQGTYNIRNALVQYARSQIVTFQDSDDIALPTRIEKQLHYKKNKRTAAVIGSWVRISEDGSFILGNDGRFKRMSVVSIMLDKNDLLLTPYRSARFGADTEYLTNLKLKHGNENIPIQPDPLIFGLMSGKSLTQTHGIEAREDGYRAPVRREYAKLSFFKHLLQSAHLDEQIETTLRNANALAEPSGVKEIIL